MSTTLDKNPVSLKMQELSKIGSEIRNTFMLGQKLRIQNPNLIDLSLGNPDLEPPKIVKEKILELMDSNESGAHRYMDSAGLLDVREFLATELTKSEQVPISAENVFLTVGAAGALQICMRALLDFNDEVIIFSPYFPEYLSYSNHLNVKPVIIESNSNHEPIVEQLEQKITSKTKLVILNSPNNPSGVFYSETLLKKIFSILENACLKFGHIIPLISDEPYLRLLFVEREKSMMQLYPYTLLARSLSKDLGLAGERIGYLAWNSEAFSNELNLIDTFRNSARVSGFVSAPRLMQRLIPSIFHAKVDVNEYQKRVECFVNILQNAGISCVKPSAGFFVFPSLEKNWTDVEFCDALAQNGVLCVPGRAFGKPDHIRVSLTQDIAKIEVAGNIIANVYNGSKNEMSAVTNS